VLGSLVLGRHAAEAALYWWIMRRPLEPGSEARAIVDDELAQLGRVRALLAERADVEDGGRRADYDADLVALRDQISDEKQEDLPSLVEQMTRVSALRGRRQRGALPVDAASPYFAHLRLRTDGDTTQDVLIGRRGLIDRAAGVQIVDWRDAPVSQVYYRYDEGDDYDEEVAGTTLRGVVLARRNVAIAGGQLRRIGCPQGTFVGSGDGAWFELEGQGVALLEGGAATAARPPRPTVPPRRGHRREVARPARSDKQLPEIAALIDRAQWGLITERSSGLVVIQGGAGSGKTTVALHRIAYLVFHDRAAFRPSKCLFVVPSEALARYVSGVLPALGVQGVPVVTFRAWVRNLRKRLLPRVPDRYTDETPVAVARLKKHPALLSLLESAVDAEVAAARALLAERLAGAPGAEWVLADWDARADAPPVGRARAVRSRVTQRRLTLPAPTAHGAEKALSQAVARLSDARRILSELVTDRARLEVLRAPGVVEPATGGELDEQEHWTAAQLDEV
jgi:DNA helicase-2/ATP-dependent DNA helicase PcrA